VFVRVNEPVNTDERDIHKGGILGERRIAHNFRRDIAIALRHKMQIARSRSRMMLSL